MNNLKIEYFAKLREKSGKAKENIDSKAQTACELYQELKDLYGFDLDLDAVKFAVNDEFVSADYKLKKDDKIVFIPPVAGG